MEILGVDNPGGGDGSENNQLSSVVHKCPRCDSTNTKFCYYNNYSFSQPRHYCRACRRYWTRGGVLRNIPVGGGCRKHKRPVIQPPPAVRRAFNGPGSMPSALAAMPPPPMSLGGGALFGGNVQLLAGRTAAPAPAQQFGGPPPMTFFPAGFGFNQGFGGFGGSTSGGGGDVDDGSSFLLSESNEGVDNSDPQ